MIEGDKIGVQEFAARLIGHLDRLAHSYGCNEGEAAYQAVKLIEKLAHAVSLAADLGD